MSSLRGTLSEPPTLAIEGDWLAEEVVETGPTESVVRTLFTTWEGRLGLTIGVLMIVLVLFGPLVAPHPPTELNVGAALEKPSASHLLGTDTLGRDILSRFLHGGRTILFAPWLAVSLALLVGGALGMLGGYLGGRVDAVVIRVFDVLATLPPLLIVLVLIAGLGTSFVVLVTTVAAVFIPRVGRIVRGATQAVGANDYVLAAQARGEPTSSILLREVAPNIAAPVVAEYALRLTYAIIFVASINFLGLGAQPPSPDWGVMVAESRTLLAHNPLATFVPAAAIVAISLSYNLLAESFTRHLSRDRRLGEIPL